MTIDFSSSDASINDYNIEWACDNCKNMRRYEIEKGTLKEEILLDIICEKCGCHIMIIKDDY